MLRFARPSIGALVFVLALLGLASCTPAPYGNHSLAEINDVIKKTGLIYSGAVGVQATSLPFAYDYYGMLSLSAAASRPENLEKSIDFLLRAAWSQNGTRTSGGGVTVVTPDGTRINVCTFARQKLNDADFECTGFNNIMTQLYGRWPGPLPELPPALTHLTSTRCQGAGHGAHGCEQVAQTAAEATGEEIVFKDMPNADPNKTDLVINTSRVEPENLDYLLRMAWSETSVNPTGDIIVFSSVHFGSEFVVENRFYVDDEYDFPCNGGSPVGANGVSFDHQCMEQLYGPWPGPPPEPPAPATTTAPTSASPSPSS